MTGIFAYASRDKAVFKRTKTGCPQEAFAHRHGSLSKWIRDHKGANSRLAKGDLSTETRNMLVLEQPARRSSTSFETSGRRDRTPKIQARLSQRVIGAVPVSSACTTWAGRGPPGNEKLAPGARYERDQNHVVRRDQHCTTQVKKVSLDGCFRLEAQIGQNLSRPRLLVTGDERSLPDQGER